MMTERSIDDWLARLPDHFIPENAAGIDAVIQLNLSGEESGQWYVTIQNQQLTVTPGVAPNPRLTLGANSQDVQNILTGKQDPMRAFMQGKLKVTGDIGFATKMTNLFRK
jgi:putative sterol carrier protein